MHNTRTLFGIALVALIACTLAACGDGGGGGGDPPLSGSISITANGSPVTTALVGTTLTANYTGTETVSYQWRRSGANVGTNTNAYTPDVAGSYTVTVSASGFSSKTSVAVSVTGHDFTTQFALLGLPNGTNVISQMNTRWDNAQNTIGGDGSTKFYPIGTPTVTGITVDGENLSGCGIYGMVPQMIFLLKGSNLTVWGRNNGSAITESISFDIAVIRNNDSKGWLNQGSGGSPWRTESYAYGTAHQVQFSLSGLTNGTVTNASQIGTTINNTTYSVYIIVRNTRSLSTAGNLNIHPQFSQVNVIKPQQK